LGNQTRASIPRPPPTPNPIPPSSLQTMKQLGKTAMPTEVEFYYTKLTEQNSTWQKYKPLLPWITKKLACKENWTKLTLRLRKQRQANTHISKT